MSPTILGDLHPALGKLTSLLGSIHHPPFHLNWFGKAVGTSHIHFIVEDRGFGYPKALKEVGGLPLCEALSVCWTTPVVQGSLWELLGEP